MINLLVTFSLILIPLIIWIGFGDGVRAPKEIASIICLFGIIGVAVTKYAMRPFKQKWVFLFVLWCAASTLFSNYMLKLEILTDLSEANIAATLLMPSRIFHLQEMYFILLAFVSIYVLSSSVARHGVTSIGNVHVVENAGVFDMRIISNAVSFVILALCLYAIVQALGLDQIFRVGNPDFPRTEDHPIFGRAMFRGAFAHRIVGTLGNPAILGTWLALSAPFLYYSWKKRIVHIALLIVVLLITDSTTAQFCFVIVTLFYLLSKLLSKNRVLPFILASIIAVSIMASYAVVFLDVGHFIKNKNAQSALNTTGRALVHYEAAKLCQNNFMFGMGLGTFEEHFTKNQSMFFKMSHNSWRQMHDEYGQIWFSVGLVGLVLFVLALFHIFAQYTHFLKVSSFPTGSIVLMSSFIGYMIMSTTYFPMRVPPHSFYLVITTGLLLNQIQGE